VQTQQGRKESEKNKDTNFKKRMEAVKSRLPQEWCVEFKLERERGNEITSGERRRFVDPCYHPIFPLYSPQAVIITIY
jgi:hypothetical protein